MTRAPKSTGPVVLEDDDGGWPRVVISDIHLGSPHCRADDLRRFLELLPAEATLILNGDTIDDPGQELPAAHQSVLDQLAELAAEDRLIWIFGNHDDAYIPLPRESCPVGTSCLLPGRLLILHGDSFDNVMPRYRWFLSLFKWLHHLRVSMGARPVHVARFAKHFKPLYMVLCRSVQSNAVDYAVAQQLETITCGHVHAAEDSRHEGIRYLNTGCWTEEEETRTIIVQDDRMDLLDVDDLLAANQWPAEHAPPADARQ